MHFNGHREWLEEYVEANPNKKSVQAVVARAALYLGQELASIAWATAEQGATRPKPPEWWIERHGLPPGMDEV